MSDQYTRQGWAFLQGRLDVPKPNYYIELVTYKDKTYNTFPPTPALFEMPLILAFGYFTPTYLVLCSLLIIAALTIFSVAITKGFSPWQATFLSIGLTCGTNVFSSAMRGGVWFEAQIYGFCLATLAVAALLHRSPKVRALGFVPMSFAVGCRPFYILYYPLLMILDRDAGEKNSRVIFRTILFGAPYLALLALHNYVRFDNPFQFGHSYLPQESSLKYGSFAFQYLPRNLYYFTSKLPTWNPQLSLPDFSIVGTAFWISNPILVCAIFALFSLRKNLTGKIALGIFLLNTFALLLHENTGANQFGYRYCIDLVPLAFFALAHEARRLKTKRWFLPLVLYSVAVNVYGTWWIGANHNKDLLFFVRKGMTVSDWQVNHLTLTGFWPIAVIVFISAFLHWKRTAEDRAVDASPRYNYDKIPCDYYDRITQKGNGIQSLWHRQKFRHVKEAIPKTATSILDVGCFAGTFLGKLAEKRLSRQVGVDILPAPVAYAEKTYGTSHRKFKLLKSDEGIAKLKGSFDCITLIEVIEHLTYQEIASLLSRLVDKLNEDGHLIITTPNYASAWPLLEAIVTRVSPISYEEQHLTKFTLQNAVEKLRLIFPDFDRSFTVEKVYTTHFLTPFLAPFLGTFLADSLSRLWPHQKVVWPFGALVVMVIKKRSEKEALAKAA